MTPNIPKTTRDCRKALRFAQIHKLPETFNKGVSRLSQYIEKNNDTNKTNALSRST